MTLRPLKVLLVINISWAFCYDETDKETLTAIFKKKPFKSRNVNIESKFFNENCESNQGFFGTNYYCEFNTDQDDEFKS